MPKLAESPIDLKLQVVRTARAMAAGGRAGGASAQDLFNAAALLLTVIALRERVTFAQLLVLLRSDWAALDGPPCAVGDAVGAARAAGFEDLASTLEAELAHPTL